MRPASKRETKKKPGLIVTKLGGLLLGIFSFSKHSGGLYQLVDDERNQNILSSLH